MDPTAHRFERNGSQKKRTLLNMVLSRGSVTGIEYLLIIQGPLL
jgi:hypothetical protein